MTAFFEKGLHVVTEDGTKGALFFDTHDGSNNRNRMFFDNCDAIVSTATAVIFFNNHAYFVKFLLKKKFYFTYVEARIEIMSLRLW